MRSSRRLLGSVSSFVMAALLLAGCTAQAPRSQLAAPDAAEGVRISSSGSPSQPSGQPVSASAAPDPAETYLVRDLGRVPHVFVHSLIVDPSVAFSSKDRNGYLDYMVTVSEFTKMMQQMHAKGYVLVSPHQLAKLNGQGIMVKTPIRLPKGKRPFVLSVDDVNYYEYMDHDGFATRLVVGPGGRVSSEYRDPKTKRVTLGAFDVVPLLDDFVAKNPDFSYHGARGVLAVTGYNGVFGYRTSEWSYGPNSDDVNTSIAADRKRATEVADALKAGGWEIASHSWGHRDLAKVEFSNLQWDAEHWRDEVQPIVGKTDLLIYPYGADISDDAPYVGARYDYLRRMGFHYFFNVDGTRLAWGQFGRDYVRQARINLDGITLHGATQGLTLLNNFFEPRTVIDPARPKSIRGTP